MPSSQQSISPTSEDLHATTQIEESPVVDDAEVERASESEKHRLVDRQMFTWQRIGLPDEFGVVAAIDVAFATWDGSWSEPEVLTHGNEVLETATISDRAVVVAVWDGYGPDVGETSVLWTTDGNVFDRQFLTPGPPDRTALHISRIGIHGTDVWLFGTETTSAWGPVIDQLPDPARRLIARGEATLRLEDDQVVVSLRPGQTIATYSLDSLGMSFAQISGDFSLSIAWQADLENGSFQSTRYPFRDGRLLLVADDPFLGLAALASESEEYVLWELGDRGWYSLAIGPIDGIPFGIAFRTVMAGDALLPIIHQVSAQFSRDTTFDMDAQVLEGESSVSSNGMVVSLVDVVGPFGFVSVDTPRREIARGNTMVAFTSGGDVLAYAKGELVGRSVVFTQESALAMRLMLNKRGQLDLIGVAGEILASIDLDDVEFPSRISIPVFSTDVAVINIHYQEWRFHSFHEVEAWQTSTYHAHDRVFVAFGPQFDAAGTRSGPTVWIGTYDNRPRVTQGAS